MFLRTAMRITVLAAVMNAILISPAIAQQPNTAAAAYVRRSALWPAHVRLASALGDRIEKPGKERLTAEGTLIRGTGSGGNIRLVWESPGRVRLDELGTGQPRTTAFDGARSWSSTGTVTRADEDLLETLINDGAEHFLLAQMNGSATRFLGYRFRPDDGRNAGYRGPFFDIYQMTDLARTGQPPAPRVKLFYFESDHGLLDRVRYTVVRNGAPIQVEIRFSEWRAVNGQQFPGKISREENGHAVLTFTFHAFETGPAVPDGIFGQR